MNITILLIIIILLVLLNAILLFSIQSKQKKENDTTRLDALLQESKRIEQAVREELRTSREESNNLLKENREELAAGSSKQREELSTALGKQREELTALLNKQRDEISQQLSQLRTELAQAQTAFRTEISGNQKELASNMERKQESLIQSTEKKLEEMRATVDEKLQQTLNERISQSFQLVSKQLESVQNGLGEMKNLATDVSGLKKVLSNVKVRGTFGEVQLGALLEQMLSPEQYDTNVRTKRGSSDVVEFAVKLPGKDSSDRPVYLPIDAKFPKDAYEQFTDAYDAGDPIQIATTSKQLEAIIRKMAKDIHDKYIDTPYTTDFAILFLPFESIYAEVIRRTELMENLQRQFKVIVTGPTTLGAILNSLQMGFKTLAIEKRSSEVWQVLGAVKTEFGKFGVLLDKVHNNLQIAGNNLDQIRGTRTKAITRKLREVESLPADQSAQILPMISLNDSSEDETETEPETDE
jgi:DNA recombination protein RmuC